MAVQVNLVPRRTMNTLAILRVQAWLAATALLGLAWWAALLPPALGADPVVQGKSWPPGHFLKYRKITPKERQEILGDIAAKLKDLNEAGESLVVKGTVIDKLTPEKKIYDKLTVLDESGLRVIVRQMPNIYYGFSGPPHLMNPNVYLIIKKVKLNETDSLIKEAFVVEGEYHAYAHAYITAIQESLGRALQGDLKQRE